MFGNICFDDIIKQKKDYMDNKAFFKLSYGLFLAGVEYQQKYNACIINTASQATSSPPVMLATMLKSNLTTELFLSKKSMNISVISQNCSLDVINHFGLNSGRDFDKFENTSFAVDKYKNPFIEEGMNARFVCTLNTAKELSTHYLFILDVENSFVLSDEKPMTYADYRVMKNNSDRLIKSSNRSWVCSICHYVYDGATPFEELDENYKCPVCGKGKEYFICET